MAYFLAHVSIPFAPPETISVTSSGRYFSKGSTYKFLEPITATFIMEHPYRLCIDYIVACIAYKLQLFFISILKKRRRIGYEYSCSCAKIVFLELCGERNISINKLANICGLPPSSVKNILYGKSQNPKILTVKMICDGLGITLAQFFDTDEFNHLEQEIR